VTVEGANSGGLLSRFNGLSLFVPVSQLEKKGANEWWTEQVGPATGAWCSRHPTCTWYFLTTSPGLVQDMVAHFAGQEVSLAVLEVTRASRKVVCSVVKAKENNDLRRLEVGKLERCPA